MSYQFDRTDGQRLESASNPITGYPIAVSCWVWLDTATDWQTVLSISEGDAKHLVLYARSDAGNGEEGPGVWSQTNPLFDTGILALDTWHHLGWSSSGRFSHRLLINGDVYTSTDDFATFPSSASEITIGGNIVWTDETMDGRIAEVAVWNAGHLTTGEEQALAAGVSPALIRPESLVAYPDLSYSLRDRIGGAGAWSASGSPTAGADHPPGILYPGQPSIGWIPGVSGTTYQRAILEGMKAGG